MFIAAWASSAYKNQYVLKTINPRIKGTLPYQLQRLAMSQ
jgi:hypothetical protein